MDRTLSVVVTTYNAPRALGCVLAGLSRQSVAPLEILVADDGSTGETASCIEYWRPLLPAPLHHVRHEDKGYRKATIVNKTMLQAHGDYAAFLDGDTIPHRHWVKDHLERSRPNRVLCGRRGRLGPEITPTITPEFVVAGGLEEWFGPVGRSARARDSRKLARSIRLPFVVSWAIGLKPRKLMGCNFSLPRAAFVAVNGYDEEFDVYWGEDRDLGERLRNSGMRMVPIINRACVWHLHHTESRMSPELHALRNAKIALRRTRCENGMDAHAGAEDCRSRN
jgi:glycosyltransferase involved in cell wall biosynthesis